MSLLCSVPVVYASPALKAMRDLKRKRNVFILVTVLEPDEMRAILLLLMSTLTGLIVAMM